MKALPIAIIGAGMAGLACARRLSDAGRRVLVLDKGRSPGGRMATRRVDTPFGGAQFDHGAQYFTVRDPGFSAALSALRADGVVQPWPAAAALRGEDCLVGAPGMSALAKAMAVGLEITDSSRVTAICRDGDTALILVLADGTRLGPFSLVIVATPAEQAVSLLLPVSGALAQEAARARTAPCWAGLFGFERDPVRQFAARRLDSHPVLAWAALDTAKPSRPSALDCWVVHARPDWTLAHLDAPQDWAREALFKALCELIGERPAPVVAQAHRWLYAQVETPVGTAFGWDRAAGIAAIGDWRLGGRIEQAWISGDALAQAVLS